MRQENIAVIPSQTAASVNGSAIIAQNLINASVQMVATGAAAGTLKIQVSNDITTNSQSFTPTNWTDLSGASVAVSGAGTYLIPIQNLCYEYIRVVYTNTGTGTIAARLKCLGV